MKKTAAIILISSIALWPACDAAAKQPVGLSSDQRIKQILYDPNQVTEIIGTYGYVTTIEFAPGEIITGRTFGDSIAWQTVIRENHLYLKPVEPEASGNMTVVTNRHTYLFKLDSSNTDMTFMVRFKYPELNAGTGTGAAADKSVQRTGKNVNPADLNLNYAAAGHKSARPLLRVFDDGAFTYFQFAGQADLPAIYFLESDGSESSVNVHRDGAYLVAERIARRFVLRNGQAHLCVENAGLAGGNGG